MPLPILFIGTAIATGLFGSGKTAKAVINSNKAKEINKLANEGVINATEKLDMQRQEVQTSLENLGSLKLFVLKNNVNSFLDTFEQIKNVDFTESTGLEELQNLHIDQQTFAELRELGNFAIDVAGGVAAGAVGGALTAIGAYGAATTFAAASTGTAIATLSGAAATNATLAFFGGGSLAAGGLGIAGGMMVLGGLVAGPALMVMGLITGAKADEKLEKAMANQAQAEETIEALNTASFQCTAIRRRTNMFYNLLAHLDSYFLKQIWVMEDIVKEEGTDYRAYKPESKKAVAAAVSTAASIKAVLDTPILTDEGSLTEQSEEMSKQIAELIYKQN